MYSFPVKFLKTDSLQGMADQDWSLYVICIIINCAGVGIMIWLITLGADMLESADDYATLG